MSERLRVSRGLEKGDFGVFSFAKEFFKGSPNYELQGMPLYRLILVVENKITIFSCDET